MQYVDHGAGGAPDCMRLAQGPLPSPGPNDVAYLFDRFIQLMTDARK